MVSVGHQALHPLTSSLVAGGGWGQRLPGKFFLCVTGTLPISSS